MNDTERTSKNLKLSLKLSNELLKDGECELESLIKAEKVEKKKIISASAKIGTSLKRCAEFQSEKNQLSEKPALRCKHIDPVTFVFDDITFYDY